MELTITSNNVEIIDNSGNMFTYSIDLLIGKEFLIEGTTNYLILTFNVSTKPVHKILLTSDLLFNGAAYISLESFTSLLNGALLLNNIGTDLAQVVVVVSGYIYTGIAPIGSLQSAAVWKVKRVTDTTPYITTWAGSGNFNQIMSNYLTLIYS